MKLKCLNLRQPTSQKCSVSLRKTIYSILLLIEVITLGSGTIAAPASAGTSSGHYWAAVQEGGNHYGSKGSSSAQNAQVTGSSNNFFVNSTFVYKDSSNYAEVGWTWHGGDTAPQFFYTSNKNGVVNHGHGVTIGVGSSHTYRTNVLPNSFTWVFYGDSTQLTSRSLSFTNAKPGAQQERNNACDTPDISHWWSLQRSNSNANFSSWTSLSKRQDNDPDYCLDKVSQTEFYVRRTGSSACDL